MSDATSEQYRNTFELSNDAQAVLDALTSKFGGQPFTPGAPDVTAFKLGQKSVIEHIHSMIAAGNR